MTRLLFFAAMVAAAVQGIDTSKQASSDEAEALRVAVSQAIAADNLADPSIEHVNERIERWTSVLVMAPRGSVEATDAEAAVALARRDLQLARSRAFESGNLDESTRGVFDAKLAAARDYLAVKEWPDAEENVRYVLARSPTYPPALSLLDELQRKQSAAESRRMLIFVGVGLAVVLLLGVMVVTMGFRARDARQVGTGGAPASRNVVLQIVEGVGKGTVVTIGRDRPAFRIGAASGAERGQERNDLIISDSARLVSRFHCTVARSGAGYCLVDSSTNGTFLNGMPATRGQQVPLADGDEITIAEVSRLKFQHP